MDAKSIILILLVITAVVNILTLIIKIITKKIESKKYR